MAVYAHQINHAPFEKVSLLSSKVLSTCNTDQVLSVCKRISWNDIWHNRFTVHALQVLKERYHHIVTYSFTDALRVPCKNYGMLKKINILHV